MSTPGHFALAFSTV